MKLSFGGVKPLTPFSKASLGKHEGGLSIRNTSLMNISLLTKRAWRILSNPNFVARVLKAKKEKGNGWKNINKVTNPIFI